MIPLNRTLFGRLFVLNNNFDKNTLSSGFTDTFKLGNNWHGGLVYRNTYKNYYGKPINNIRCKYSHIWINHNIQHLYFKEEILTITTDNADHLISSNYKLSRMRFLHTPILENIKWNNIPKNLIYFINKK